MKEEHICVIVRSGKSALLDDALHRIVAELRAAGFSVKRISAGRGTTMASEALPASCRSASGRLLLRRSRSVLSIFAAARGDSTSLSQDIRLASRSTTAELVAIRAVESLRAAMIQAMRSGEQSGNPSETVRRFTHYEREERDRETTVPERPAAEERAPAEEELVGTKNSSEEDRADALGNRTQLLHPAKFLFALGGGIGLDGGDPGLPAELSANWRPNRIVVGVLVDASLVPGEWNTAAGQIAPRHYSLLARFAWRLPCGSSLECEVGISGGARAVSIRATSSTSSEAESRKHTSALVSGDAFGGYFFDSRWGAGVRVRVGSLIDAPALNIGDSDKLWGRPTLTGALLLLARY